MVFKVLWKKYNFICLKLLHLRRIRIRNSAFDAETARAAATHLFFEDADPAVFLNADPDPALKTYLNFNFVKIYFRQYGTGTEKIKKDCLESKKPWSWSKCV